jgi:hypothetical protein
MGMRIDRIALSRCCTARLVKRSEFDSRPSHLFGRFVPYIDSISNSPPLDSVIIFDCIPSDGGSIPVTDSGGLRSEPIFSLKV